MATYNLDIYPKNEYKIWFAGIPYTQQPKVPKSVLQWSKEQGADICYNLAMFNMTHGKMENGMDWYGGTVQDMVANNVRIGYGGAQKDYLKLPNGDYCNGYKTAIKNGKILSGLNNSTRRSRNCNGWTKEGHYFHLQTSKDVTEYECATYMSQRGATLMLLQDGGGSTARVANGKVVFAPERGRPVSSVVCIKKLSPDPKPMEQPKVTTGVETNIPLNGTFAVTAAFGEVRPDLWKTPPHIHRGIDLTGSDDIYATCDGVVTVVAFDTNGWGQYISIKPNDNPNRRHLFCHLVKGSQRVKVGDKVSRKTIIGKMGATGNVTGKHLHYEIRDNNVSVDPSVYMGIPNKRGSYNAWNYVIGKKVEPPKPPKKYTIKVDGVSEADKEAIANYIRQSKYNPTITEV